MNDPNFQQFLQMLIQANPHLAMNPGMINPGMGGFNINIQQIQNMLNMMGLFGANPDNYINIFNPQRINTPYNPSPHNSPQYINIIFIQRNQKIRITIQASLNESVASVVNKYINKSGDYKINMYILNGHKLDERLKVIDAGLRDNCYVDVIEIDELEGAKNKKI